MFNKAGGLGLRIFIFTQSFGQYISNEVKYQGSKLYIRVFTGQEEIYILLPAHMGDIKKRQKKSPSVIVIY